MSQQADIVKATGNRIGYTRVSTVAQTLDQQNDALAAAGVAKVFSDVMPGARDDRPGLAALLEYVREGDTVVVWKLDRLGRNMLHILQTVRDLTDQGVTLVSVTDGIDSSTPAGRMMIGVLGSLAEYERELVKECTALKRASSRVNGTKFDRPRKVTHDEYIASARRMQADGHPVGLPSPRAQARRSSPGHRQQVVHPGPYALPERPPAQPKPRPGGHHTLSVPDPAHALVLQTM